MAVFGVGYDFGASVLLLAAVGATLINVVLALFRKKAADWSTVFVYEIGLFFAFFVVLTLLNDPAANLDIQTGDPGF